MKIRNGELVLLLSEDEKYMVRVSKGKMQVKSGIIDITKIMKKKFGDTIKTHTGKTFTLSKPSLLDVIEKRVKRTAQVITPKDSSLIIAYTGLRPDAEVIEAGSGTGYNTIFLANHVPNGHVTSYEIDRSFHENAKRNIAEVGLKNVTLKKGDVTKKIAEKDADLVILDMQKASGAIKNAYKSLRVGGYLSVYSPTIDSLASVLGPIKKVGFSDVRTIESIIRDWQIGPTIRPKTMGLMHTGFLTFARKRK